MRDGFVAKKAHFYVHYSNMAVLKNYLSIIRSALINNGFACDEVVSLDGLDKKDLYVFPMGIDAFRFYRKGYKNYILWQQGATADESYMRHHSMLRYKVLNSIDCFVMKNAKFIFFCSQEMKEHYENLSHCIFDDKSYLMPCFNEQLSEESILQKDYSKKNFAYVGSLELWQCFEETALLYKKIEDIYPDAHLRVLTFAKNEAEATEKIKAIGIQNYDVKSVKAEEVQRELSDSVYGFILRRVSVVNRVATPTKISSYLSAGLIPIYSPVLHDFKKASEDMKYVIPLEENDDMNSLCKKLGMPIRKEELMLEYRALFSTYYGTAYHTEKATQLLKGICS